MARLIPDTKENRELAKKLAEKAKTLNYIKSVKPAKDKKPHK
ncbi:hypothetical protein JNUCC23_02080 [Peribacillus sp. JNUCC 23]